MAAPPVPSITAAGRWELTMRFAVFDHNDASGRPAGQQLDERLELVAAYERLGFYAYQMAEHHGTPLGIATPHLLLAAASRLTSEIRLGTLISILPIVPPMRMIEEAATLDQLSHGRLVLGVGRGVSPVETGFHGVPGKEAQPRFDEAFEILMMGLSSDVVDFHGTYYDISSAPVVTRPVQQPLIPWYATATEDKARWCARLSMPMMALVPSEQVRTLTDAYRDEWASLGRDPADLPPLGVSRQLVVADTSEKAQEIADRAFTPFASNLAWLWEKFDVPITAPLLTRPGFATDASGHRFAGDPAGARDWVARHAEVAGVDYFALELAFGDMTAAEVLRSAELFSAEVMPAFR
jgi:alkanesulfonate monooxygenase SsuD/methylene tetrahydromethanopterin reductase-like flavin-dependent oxidoreductase (luciferase family)